MTVYFCNWLCKTVCSGEVGLLLTFILLMQIFRFVISMSGFCFQLGSVHKLSARIKLTSETTRFKMSSICTFPHTTSWCILQRQLRTVVPTFLFVFPTRLSLTTVVARAQLVRMHKSWISVLQKICSPVTVPCIIIIFRSHLFSAKFE